MYGAIATWRVLPPAGLTDKGRIRRFQDRTVARLSEQTRAIVEQAYTELLAGIESIYTEGTGELAGTVHVQYKASRDGISVDFVAGTNHLVYLTGLAGVAPFNPEGHMIYPRRAKRLRFFWKNPLHGMGPPGVYEFGKRGVQWKTRRGVDVMGNIMGDYANRFQRAMIATHETALTEFVQNELQNVTRSPRISIGSFNG